MWSFYLLVFLLPVNLAKHFPLPFSYVNGYLVDYLIPAVYLTDILIILLLILKPLKKIPSYILIFLACLLPSVIFSASFWPAIYKFIKLLELSLLAAWTIQYQAKINKKLVIAALSATVLFQSLLAAGQWFNQGSLFGYWFFGEQPYTASTTGIDKITWFDGSLKLPPLGTFPHPNVLAGFLAVSLPLIFPVRIFWLGLIPLFLTFSLSGWLAFVLISVPILLKFKSRLLFIYFGCLLIFFSLTYSRLTFLAPESSFSRRSQLTAIALKMIQNRPLTGIGLNNFTVVMDQYGYVPAEVRFLQPVHNLFLLILSETGLIGLIGFSYLLLHSKKSLPLFILLFLGLFDHYFFTLQQGILLFFLLL